MSPSTFRFVHASDLRLGAPFQGLRRATPAVTRAVCDAPLAAWDALVQLTISQDAAFLLLAGNVCDGTERAIQAQRRFLGGLQRLSAHGVPTFIVRGDAEPVERWMGIRQWPDGVSCFGSHDVESLPVMKAGERVATIHGISYSPDDAGAQRVGSFRRGTASGLHIALIHASAGPVGDGAPVDARSVDDLRPAGMDYWALGGSHRYQALSEGRPWAVSPGTIQGRSLDADETGAKGAAVVEVVDGAISAAAFHALESVRLLTTDVDVSALSGVRALREAFVDRARQLRDDHPGRNLVVRAVVRGQRDAYGDRQRSGAFRDWLLEELRAESVGTDTFLWWDSVRDITQAPASGVSADQHDPSVYVRKLAESWRHAPVKLQQIIDAQAGSGISPDVGSLQPAVDSTGDVHELLTRAERMALDLVARDQS